MVTKEEMILQHIRQDLFYEFFYSFFNLSLSIGNLMNRYTLYIYMYVLFDQYHIWIIND